MQIYIFYYQFIYYFKEKCYNINANMNDKVENLKEGTISSVFLTTAITFIATAMTGVIAITIDGLIASRFLSIDVYSAISLFSPFARIIGVFAGFLATGCNVVCSRLVGAGKKKETNGVFNLTIIVSILVSILITLFSIYFPNIQFKLSGINLTKYPELNQYLFDYLSGYVIGIPANIIGHVLGPIVVMDNGKKAFAFSTIAMCIVDIVGDLINIFIFKGGAFGMALASSVSYIVHLVILVAHFFFKKNYFTISFKNINIRNLVEIANQGIPELTKRLSFTLKESTLNYLNIMAALSTAAIAARGIQTDIFNILLCLPTGLSLTALTMSGIYHSANDKQGLKDLYSYALSFGIKFTLIISITIFVLANPIVRLYTNKPDVISLSVFAIRWVVISLVFDTIIGILRTYLQGSGNSKKSSILFFIDFFLVPVISAIVLGHLFGSKGILASIAVSKIVLFVIYFNVIVIRLKKIPRTIEDILSLSKDYDNNNTNDLNVIIHNVEEAIEISKNVKKFCLQNGIGVKEANLMSLFTEEMTTNVFQHAKNTNKESIKIDYHLSIGDKSIRFFMSDLSELFDPVVFYELNSDKNPEKLLGISTVMKGAKEVRYYNTFNGNNLIVTIDRYNTEIQ